VQLVGLETMSSMVAAGWALLCMKLPTRSVWGTRVICILSRMAPVAARLPKRLPVTTTSITSELCILLSRPTSTCIDSS